MLRALLKTTGGIRGYSQINQTKLLQIPDIYTN
jgi:hypothetical protein